MSVLVTGSTGFLGTAVVERLLAHGERQVRCFVRPNSDRSRLERIKRRHGAAHVEYVLGNLNSAKDACRAVHGVEVVYHLAAEMRGLASSIFQNTVVASSRLLSALPKDCLPRVVLVSSLSVYGFAALQEGATISESVVLERHPERRDPYSHAKLGQEQLFREHQQRHGLPLVILRPGILYGPGGTDFHARVGLRFGGWLLHFGGGNLLPLSYVDNCAEAVVLAGRCGNAPGETYNVIDDDLPSSSQYLKEYTRQVAPVRSIAIPYRVSKMMAIMMEGHPPWHMPPVLSAYKVESLWRSYRFDNSKLKQLGWKQLVTTEEGMARTFAALKVQRNGHRLPVESRLPV
jgi:nucleoside-diphosphate-sugar epimerase